MRFLHTADWHLGKKLNGFDLAADQWTMFKQIENVALTEKVDALVLAGDLFDRAVPSEATVDQLKKMLAQLNLVDQLPILAISGNHDSAPRLGMASAWYRAHGLYLVAEFAQAFEPIVIGDTQFFLLPYFTLQAARNYFADEQLRDLNQVMAKVVATMQAQFTPDKHHVLVAHFFAAGSQRTPASETMIEVGGLAAVDVALLAPFDYVALGHLHNPQALKTKRVKYSGSPLKLSASEATMTKGVRLVDLATDEVRWQPLPQHPDLVKVTGSFAELTAPEQVAAIDRENYYLLTLTDQNEIPDVMAKLREFYPRILSLHFTRQLNQPAVQTMHNLTEKSPLEQLAAFYEQTTGQPLTARQQKWAAEGLAKIKGEDDATTQA